MHKTFTFFTLLFLSISSISIGQSNFQKGYIVEIKGDTVHGFIDDRGDLRNSQLISFKASEASKPEDMSPKDLKSFQVGSKVYYSALINHKGASVSIFAELINDGRLKFFYWKDQKDGTNYFVQKDNKNYDLTNDKEEISKDGRTYTYYNKAYTSMLENLTNDCNSEKKSNLQFTLKSISKYISNYNECNGSLSYSSEKLDKKSIIKKSVFVGVNRSSVITTGDDVLFHGTNTETGLKLGAGLHINFPNFNNKLFLDIAAEYNKKGAYAEKEKITFNLHYINASTGLSYIYPKGKIRPILGAAFVAGYLVNSENAYTRLKDGKETRIFYKSADDENEVYYEVGYELNAGVKYQIINDKFVFLKAGYTNSLIPFNYLTHSYSNKVFSLKIGYEF